MSRVKEQLEQIQWDTHEQPQEEQTPIELSGEIAPDLFGIEPIKAQEMVSGLSTIFAEREVLKNAYIDVIVLPINTENLPTFKELRLKIRDNRTKGIERWHTTNKAFYLAGGRFVDAIKNKEILENVQMEEKLLEAEKFFENQEKQRRIELNNKRIEIIRPYVDDVIGLDFDAMGDEDFDDYVLGKKTRFENSKKEAEAEEKRIEEEKQREIAMQKAIELENAMLKQQSEEKEKAIEKERAEAKAKQEAIELKAKQEREKAETERKIEANRQASIQAQKDLEIRREREAKEKLEDDAKKAREEKEKAESLAIAEAAKLSKAPIKKQLSVWVDSFELPNSHCNSESVAIEIIEKFEAFKKWSINQINNL